MPPTKLLIFGNPKAGTPLVLAAPSAALDLPLKIIVAEDAEGRVSLSYNSPNTEPAFEHRRHRNPGGEGRGIARSGLPQNARNVRLNSAFQGGKECVVV
jgi:Domain of unknown function DUF302